MLKSVLHPAHRVFAHGAAGDPEEESSYGDAGPTEVDPRLSDNGASRAQSTGELLVRSLPVARDLLSDADRLVRPHRSWDEPEEHDDQGAPVLEGLPLRENLHDLAGPAERIADGTQVPGLELSLGSGRA